MRAETGAARDEAKHEINRLRQLIEQLYERVLPSPHLAPEQVCEAVPPPGSHERAALSPVKWDGTQRDSTELLDAVKTRRKLQRLVKQGVLGADEQLTRLAQSGRLLAHSRGRRLSRQIAKRSPTKAVKKKARRK